LDTSKYRNVPILIIEGFTIYESQFLFDKCDVRLFVTLNEDECRLRRKARGFNPPDVPGYFDKVVWPEFLKHFGGFVDNRTGITIFDGSTSIQRIWKESAEIVRCRLEEKYFMKENVKSSKSDVNA